MKPILYKLKSMNGWPVIAPWSDIKHMAGETISEGDEIEYAYGQPVVTDEMVLRACAAYDDVRDGEDTAEYPAIHSAITAALGLSDV